MTRKAKTDSFYRPVSEPNSKAKRGRNSVVKTGFEMAVTDPGLSLKYRLKALDSLARLNPTRRFLADLIRKTDTPSRLRLAATQLLDKIQTADKARRGSSRAEAEKTAKALLERLRCQQTEPEGSGLISERKSKQESTPAI